MDETRSDRGRPAPPAGRPAPGDDPISRRRFLTLMGATAALASSTGCIRLDRGEIVPRSKGAGEAIAGVAESFASTFQEGLAVHPVLVRTREGRPIHVSGNDLYGAAPGRAPLHAIADVLRLYDPDRLRRPLVDGKPATWAQAEQAIVPALKGARHAGRRVLLVTRASSSPTRAALIAELSRELPGLTHVNWEPTVSPAATRALELCFGRPLARRLRLDRAEVVVSLEAELLTGDRPVDVCAFASHRKPEKHCEPMSRLWVVEGRLSQTGMNADHRIQLPPSRAAAFAFGVARELHRLGVEVPKGVDLAALEPHDLALLAPACGLDHALAVRLAQDLASSGPAALFAVGPGLPLEAQVAGILVNAMLGSLGEELEVLPSAHASAPASALKQALEEARGGAFVAGVFWDVNPAYDFPDSRLVGEALSRLPVKAAITLHHDETARWCSPVLAANHWLESWGDHVVDARTLALQQPAVAPIHDTRQGEQILLGWLGAVRGAAPGDYLQYLKSRWMREVQPAGSLVPFERFWSVVLHEGVHATAAPPAVARTLDARVVSDAARHVPATRPVPGFDLVLHPSPTLADGRHANSGWLQELPDPITKLTWGNVLAVSPADAARLGLADGDVVTVTGERGTPEIPVLVQPGQTPGVVSAALGYGRRAGSVAQGVGTDLYPLVSVDPSTPFLRSGASLAKTGRRVELASTQLHHRMEGRDLARSITPATWTAKGSHGESAAAASLHADQPFPQHKWGMVIDLSACVGCGSCVVACQSENNIPSVGPDRVREGREMHWIRIDRYYEGDASNPMVVVQPILCQHCDDAPCETVCPVYATNHNDEGLNQMVYNRCVGTRYCGNNCPYRVRRFNFFEFAAGKKAPESLAMNPEVSIRPRGVMEKCTFCVQRIQEAKSVARAQGRGVQDGEIAPACAAACPSRAIVFGDLRNPGSAVSRLARSERGYKVLEELGVKPSVTYLAHVRNPARGRG